MAVNWRWVRITFGVEILGKPRLTADFGNRNSQVAQGEWQEMCRNSKNRWVSPRVPTARANTKLGSYIAKMGNCDLEGLAAQAGCDSVLDVENASASKQYRRKTRIRDVESDVVHLGDTSSSCLTKSVNAPPIKEMKTGRNSAWFAMR